MIKFPRYSSKGNSKVRGICRISIQTPGGESFTQTNSQHCAVSDLVQKIPPRSGPEYSSK